MPGCNFAASGSDFDVDTFLIASPWREFAEPFRRGEPTESAVFPIYKFSGFQIQISNSDEDDLEPQIQDIIEFLNLAGAEMDRLAVFPGVERMVFDIGLLWKKEFYQSHNLPPELMRLAGEHGVIIQLSIYGSIPPSWNNPSIKP